MRRVRVHYDDGRVVEYDAIKDAMAGLHCSSDTIIAFGMGFAPVAGRRLRAMGVAGIEVSEPRPQSPQRPEWTSAGNPVPLIITDRNGQTMTASSMMEASRLTGLAGSTIKDAVGDGRWHKGYKYDLPAGGASPEPWTDTSIRYGDADVPDDVIRQLRYMAIHYVQTCWTSKDIAWEDQDDAVDYAVARAAADYSRGVYDPARGKFAPWGYIRVKGYAAKYLRRLRRWTCMRSTAPAGEDPDKWLARQQDAEDPAETDDDYVADLPEEYRQMAALMLAGHTRHEICAIMGKPNSVLAEMRRRLGEYIRGRRYGSDSGA